MNKFDTLDSEELMLICTVIAMYLAKGKTSGELKILSSMAISIGSLLTIASNQKDNLASIINNLFDA